MARVGGDAGAAAREQPGAALTLPRLTGLPRTARVAARAAVLLVGREVLADRPAGGLTGGALNTAAAAATVSGATVAASAGVSYLTSTSATGQTN